MIPLLKKSEAKGFVDTVRDPLFVWTSRDVTSEEGDLRLLLTQLRDSASFEKESSRSPSNDRLPLTCLVVRLLEVSLLKEEGGGDIIDALLT